MDAAPVAPIPSASLMVVRDGPAGLEVLMITRHAQAGFAGGALVFPGGKVDKSDTEWAGRLPAHHGGDGAHRLAALRETFEECGLLLGRHAGSATPRASEPMPSAPTGDAPRDFASALAVIAKEPAIDALVPFADRKSTRLNSSHSQQSRMPSSA